MVETLAGRVRLSALTLRWLRSELGVLLYGQRPGARAVWRLLREGM